MAIATRANIFGQLGFAHTQLFASFPPYRVALCALPCVAILAGLGFWAMPPAQPSNSTIGKPDKTGQPPSSPPIVPPVPVQLSGDYQVCANDTTNQAQSDAQAALAACQRILSGTATGSGSMSNSNAFLGHGIANVALADQKDAMADFNQSINADSSNDTTYYFRAQLEMSQEQYQAALADAKQAVTLNPTDKWDMMARAEAELGAGNFQNALDDSNTVIAEDPTLVRALLIRGGAEAKMNNYQAAIADENQFLQKYPNQTDGLYWRGYAEAHVQGSQPQAISDLTQAAQTSDMRSQAYDALALISFKQGDYTGALSAENQAIGIAPNDAAGLTLRAGTEIHLQQFSAAQSDAEAALRQNPTGPLQAAALENLGISDEDLADWTDAIQAFQQALQVNPSNQRIAGMLADAKQHVPN